MEKTLANLIQEIRKGTLTLAVCSQLHEKHYGYSLVETLQDKGLDIDKNTLYPLLRRLEQQNILEAIWDTDSARPRKYYHLSDYGQAIYNDLQKEYYALNNQLLRMMEESK
jgi:DNA-binding PadR family transcriptional regulator